MRPYIVEQHRFDEPLPTKVIGFEIRVKHPNGIQEEVRMVELDIELPWAGPGCSWQLPCTFHTSKGDINVTVQLPG